MLKICIRNIFFVILHPNKNISNTIKVRKLIYIALAALLFCACEYRLRPTDDDSTHRIEVERYDRLESQYLTTGDYAALQQMSTDYPMETRTLIENVLKLGSVDDSEINSRVLAFFQDSTLQVLISDAEAQYANMDDINNQLNIAFGWLVEQLPDIQPPVIYAQIGTLDYSIVVGDHSLGISLDKYLGESYPLYEKYFNASQRKSMNRENIVPDCVSFYLLSLYPLHNFENCKQEERDLHVGKIMWVTNQALGKRFFKTAEVQKTELFMRKHPTVSVKQLLDMTDYSSFK